MVQFLLNVVVFVSGAVLMSLEIVGSRVLAPYFGNSIFVWGSLISVVLAALSVGYYWGGWLSAREPSYSRLLTLLVIPGVLIFFLPFIYPTVNEWIAGIDFGTRLNPLIASSIYFLLPGVFLGTVSPYVIRLAATQLSTVGSTAGTLYAVSTCGSIFGTLLTAFYLIPLMGVSNIIHFLGMILVCLSLVVVPLVKLRGIELARAVTTLSVIVGSIMMPWTPALWARTKTLLEKDTFYHRIRIEEDDEARYMYFDRTLQSAMNLKDPTALRLIYSRYTSLGFAFRPDAKKMLIIGLGGGSIAIEWLLRHPSLSAIGIEARHDRADRAARNAAALGVPELEIVQGHVPEALAGLARPDAVFVGGGMTDDGVFEAVWSALKPGGRLVANAISLETEARLADYFGRFGGDLVRLQVARIDKVGSMSGWRPAMPVTQWRVRKP